MVELYARPGEVDRLERRLGTIAAPEDCARTATALAWFYRLTDTTASFQAAERALIELDRAAGLPPSEAASLLARVQLSRAEGHVLLAEMDVAERLMAEAALLFARVGDETGLGDVALAAADMCFYLGRIDRRRDLLREAQDRYRTAGDGVRATIALGWRAILESFGDSQDMLGQWEQQLAGAVEQAGPSVGMLLSFLRGQLAFRSSDYAGAIRQFQLAAGRARDCGMLPLSLRAEGNIGTAFMSLNDVASALEAGERCHALSAATRWPYLVGAALANLGRFMLAAESPGRAGDLLRDALHWLAPFAETRMKALACQFLGDHCQALGAHDEALNWFARARGIAERQSQPDILVDALCGSALSLSARGEQAEAEETGRRALDLAAAGGDRNRHVRALQSLAEVHRRAGGPAGRAAQVERLEEAIRIGAEIPGYAVPAAIFADLSRAHEGMGDYRTALEFQRQAEAAWRITIGREAKSRLQALEVKFETERARAETDHHRELAEAQAAQARSLQEGMQTLELLGRIGLEITAKLEVEAVFEAIHRHIGALLDAPTMTIGLLDADGTALDVRYRMEDARRLPPLRIELTDPDSNAAKAVRENREIDFEVGPGVETPSHVPGTRRMLSAMFRPLAVGDRILGVMSVQSDRSAAYGERERLIFRTLGAYGAIALANAEAYRGQAAALEELHAAKDRLVQQEKLASLGQLVAGVAHEVNTPIGVILGASTHLEVEVDTLQSRIDAGTLKRSELAHFLEQARDTARLLTGNAERAADLIRNFKQVAADRASDQTREIAPKDYAAEVLASLRPMLRPLNVAVDITGDAEPRITTCPGFLAQVITNLAANAVLHAFDGQTAPRLQVDVKATRRGVRITIADNGRGMPPEIAARAFEPFFTTRRGAGGTGLGLHIVHNLVTGTLGGDITLTSEPGQGTRFDIDLPRRLPRQA